MTSPVARKNSQPSSPTPATTVPSALAARTKPRSSAKRASSLSRSKPPLLSADTQEAIEATVLHHETKPFALRISSLSSPAHAPASWLDHLKPGHLHFVLNLSGEGLVIAPETRLTLLPETVALFQVPDDPAGLLTATRFSCPALHRFLLLTISPDSLGKLFPSPPSQIAKNLGLIRRWTQRETQLFNDFAHPPVAQAAQRAWYQAKVLELLSLHLFHNPEPEEPLFCFQLKEKTHRHVRKALELLHARLSEPLDLSDLASDVGCAPHYLSRLVKQETGKTLSLHLRSFRVDRAAELLASGSHNVTEVAFEVGYNSLSHFSKAFAEEQGMPPSEFLHRRG
ncbi:MAG: AraC family transcriptional regulator [Verrucomicrobiota bacterium]